MTYASLVYPVRLPSGFRSTLSAAILNGHEQGDREHKIKMYVSLVSNEVERCVESFARCIDTRTQQEDSFWMYNWLVIDLDAWYQAKWFKRGIDCFSSSWDATTTSDNQVMEIREKLAQLQTQMVFFTFLSELYF